MHSHLRLISSGMMARSVSGVRPRRSIKDCGLRLSRQLSTTLVTSNNIRRYDNLEFRIEKKCMSPASMTCSDMAAPKRRFPQMYRFSSIRSTPHVHIDINHLCIFCQIDGYSWQPKTQPCFSHGQSSETKTSGLHDIECSWRPGEGVYCSIATTTPYSVCPIRYSPVPQPLQRLRRRLRWPRRSATFSLEARANSPSDL